MRKSDNLGLGLFDGTDKISKDTFNSNSTKIDKAIGTVDIENKGSLQQQIDNLGNSYVKGIGMELSIDENGILNVTYDDGTEEGVEE